MNSDDKNFTPESFQNCMYGNSYSWKLCYLGTSNYETFVNWELGDRFEQVHFI
jgi:hypothetical protein